MYRKLSSQERLDLIKRHRKERDKRICDRIKAVLACDKGYSYSEVAELMLLDDETIRRHIEDFFAENKLTPNNGGSTSKFTKEESAKLIEHLSENTYLYVKDICVYVKKTFGVIYSVSGMTKWLKANNFCYKKPHGVPAKANKQNQQEFIEFYADLKEETE